MKKRRWPKILLILGILITVFAPLFGAALMALVTSPEIFEKLAAILGTSADRDLEIITMFLAMVSFAAIVPGVILITIGALLPFLLGHSANSKMLAEGIEAEAEIISMQDMGARVNGDPIVLFELEIRPATSAKFTGTAKQRVDLIRLPAFQPGKNVVVKYLPGTTEAVIIGAKG